MENKEQYQQIIDEAYENYVKKMNEDFIKSDISLPPAYYPVYKDVFVEQIKTDEVFAKKWRLKIGERNLIEEERLDLVPNKNVITEAVDSFVNFQQRTVKDFLDELEVPTKLITVTYKDTTIEGYGK